MIPHIKFILLFLLFATILTSPTNVYSQTNNGFVRVSGKNLLDSKGNMLKLKGTNLGNWLVPEGYMFKTAEVGAPFQIDRLLQEIVGPDSTLAFWQKYLDTYITHGDIKYLKRIGTNHIRLPFHYKLFTDELYMGKRNAGFEYFDKLIQWCREENMYLLLDMHCAPGGQTGYNIDDSSGYPWLFYSKSSQDQMSEVWVKIAKRYKNEPVIIGYDIVNEPWASYFDNDDKDFNHKLHLIYERMVNDIRKVDKKHAIFLSGSWWAMDFRVFESILDNNVVYEFHKYHFPVKQEAIQQYLDFRDLHNVPIYIGETGENKDEWVKEFTELLNKNEVNWAYWPYKKMNDLQGVMNFKEPEYYKLISDYAKSDRSSYEKMRNNMPDRKKVQQALNELLENATFKNTFPNKGYVKGLGMVND